MKTIKATLIIGLLIFTGINLSAQEEFEVRVTGKGQPVLLFPGFTNTGEVWEGIEEELSKNYELHIFTFAGFGDVPPISTPWLSKIKDGVTGYVENKNLKKPVIIGHSLGGTLGLWLASENPGTYSKVIAVDALPAMGALMDPNYKSENYSYDSPYNQQMLEMNEEDFRNMAVQMASSMSLNKEKHSQLLEWMIQADRKTFVYGYTDLLKLDLREAISRIKIPVSLLAATHPYGKDMAEMTFRKQFENLPVYDLHFAENSAHFIMYDQPDWFLSQILSDLESK